MYEVFVLYDDTDCFTHKTLFPAFENQKLEYCSFNHFPEKTIFGTLKALDPFPNKILIILSDELCQDEIKNNTIEFVLSCASIMYGSVNKVFDRVITFITTGSITKENGLFPLLKTTIIHNNSTASITDLVSEIRLQIMPCCTILAKNGLVETLGLHGLSMKHLESEIFGLMISTQTLCLQIDLDEYFRYRQKHQDHKTLDVLGQRHVLRSPNTKVLIILDNNSNRFKEAVSDISDICSSLICYTRDFESVELVCSVAGKYDSAEENFLMDIYPNAWYGFTRKAVTDIEQPRFENYSSVEERRNSFPTAWIKSDLDQVNKIAQAGFFYPGVGLNGQCYSCSGWFSNVKYHTNPLTKHASQYPDCKFIKETLSEEEIQNAILQFNDVNTKNNFASQLEKTYCTLKSRKETFKASVCNISASDVERWAEAGFYCVALNTIQCFKCCVRLFQIPQNVNIWTIHANISPKCPYMYEKKGKRIYFRFTPF
ncbi:BIRC4 [Mytilus edulis]|uniref:XIAP n=1 Tax=Mytilus edulis TaxID=6550 RepID=A0A8S3TSG7_MYTED|nr:BIRC4 [Mytilus edulis]